MNSKVSETGDLQKLPAIKRRAVGVSQEGRVKAQLLRPDLSLPLVIYPAVDGLDLVEWVASSHEYLQSQLWKHGAILFRNFDIGSVDLFQRVITAASGELLEYRERSSPRSEISGHIYSSTDHPADQHIFLHNENSYANTWPMKIFFFCVTPARQRGETPIADCRSLYQRIDPAIRERFAEKGVMYLRNFGDGMGLSWETAFQTSSREEVEQYCREAGISCEWRSGGRLRTRAVRPAIARHPHTGDHLWFNQATLFHISTLEASVRELLLASFAEEDLPLNAYYGDGSPIEPDVVEALRVAHQRETIEFPWQQGDILMLDNMLTAHGRAPFVGPRKIVVGMSEPRTWASV